MALALCNAQGELHPLEVGLHALRSGLTQEAYGKAIGLSQDSISIRVKAGRVASTTRVVIPDRWRHLAEIHAAPAWLWPALVEAMPSPIRHCRLEPALQAVCKWYHGELPEHRDLRGKTIALVVGNPYPSTACA